MVLGNVGVTLGDELFDQRLHLFDMLGRARLDRWGQNAQRCDVVVELFGGAFGQLADGHTLLG